MAITAKQVNELRQITGAGMMDCKKALTEANGDIEAAIDILRKKGQKVAAKREDREAAEGKVFIKISDDTKEGVGFALKCETDFVAKNDDFVKLGEQIADLAFAEKPANTEALHTLQLGDQSVKDTITEMIGRIGEKIEISGYTHTTGETVVPYIHGDGKIGVLVTLANTGDVDVTDAGKDIAMQIAAMKPIAVDESGVPEDLVEREKQVGLDKAREEGKPEHILEKIADGFVKKFYQENTLLNQAFVKDNKQTVKQYLNGINKGLTVTAFSRISIGR